MDKPNSLAGQFLNHANEFNDAAIRLSREEPFLYHPTFYCALHSIELALKAHLALAGFPRRRLASKLLGHHLGKLLETALQEGALDRTKLNSADQRAVTWGARDYSAKCFEYPEFMVSTLPIGRWLAIARKLIDNAQRCISATP